MTPRSALAESPRAVCHLSSTHDKVIMVMLALAALGTIHVGLAAADKRHNHKRLSSKSSRGRLALYIISCTIRYMCLYCTVTVIRQNAAQLYRPRTGYSVSERKSELRTFSSLFVPGAPAYFNTKLLSLRCLLFNTLL